MYMFFVIIVHDYADSERVGSNYASLKHDQDGRDVKVRFRAAAPWHGWQGACPGARAGFASQTHTYSLHEWGASYQLSPRQNFSPL